MLVEVWRTANSMDVFVPPDLTASHREIMEIDDDDWRYVRTFLLDEHACSPNKYFYGSSVQHRYECRPDRTAELLGMMREAPRAG